jgi:hypothetical protein
MPHTGRMLSVLSNPWLGLVLFILAMAFHAVMRANECYRPLNALSGLLAVWGAAALAIVTPEAWWGFFLRIGGAIRFSGDAALDAFVAMGSVFALTVAWLCMIAIERSEDRPNAVAAHCSALTRASLTVIGIAAAGYAVVFGDAIVPQPMMMAAYW